MYWNSTCCTVTVSLCKPECDLFDVLSSVPHAPLARSHKDEWKDISPWTHLCEEATDWEQILDPKVLFFPSLHMYSTSWSTAVPATLTVLVIQENTIQTLVSQPTRHEPELSTVPDCVWAAHKYDVGLIHNYEPLVVTPKSTHRPRRANTPSEKRPLRAYSQFLTPCWQREWLCLVQTLLLTLPFFLWRSTPHRRHPKNGGLFRT